MTLELLARRATTRRAGRLTARSSIATADAELARRTLVQLAEPRLIEDAGERVLARLRRLVVGGTDSQDSRS